eukprot:1181844-Prorocentrum_minimum.AAC.1
MHVLVRVIESLPLPLTLVNSSYEAVSSSYTRGPETVTQDSLMSHHFVNATASQVEAGQSHEGGESRYRCIGDSSDSQLEAGQSRREAGDESHYHPCICDFIVTQVEAGQGREGSESVASRSQEPTTSFSNCSAAASVSLSLNICLATAEGTFAHQAESQQER